MGSIIMGCKILSYLCQRVKNLKGAYDQAVIQMHAIDYVGQKTTNNTQTHFI